jgi:hypothetical protein
MSIQTIWVQNPNDNILQLNLRSSEFDHGLLIFNLEGLGSPKATVNSTGGPNFDGTRVSSVRTDSRHLILTLAVTGRGDLEEEAKDKIYTYFPVKKQIILGIKTDRKDVYIPAIVESNDFGQFAKVENAVIGLYCANPYFLDVLEQTVNIGADSVVPLFEFPFENDGLLVDDLEFGYITALPTADISYSGEVETGIDIALEFLGAMSDVITITNSNNSQTMTIDFSGVFAAAQTGDQIFINTRSGEKSAYFVRSTVWYNMINGIGINDDWIQLHPGSNTIILNADNDIDQVETEITYRALSEGV